MACTADFLQHFYRLPEGKWPSSVSSTMSSLSSAFPPCIRSHGLNCSLHRLVAAPLWSLQSLTSDRSGRIRLYLCYYCCYFKQCELLATDAPLKITHQSWELPTRGASQSPDPAALTQQDARVISEEIHALGSVYASVLTSSWRQQKEKVLPSRVQLSWQHPLQREVPICFCPSEGWGSQFALIRGPYSSPVQAAFSPLWSLYFSPLPPPLPTILST